ncbi:TAXI family TRAP transporter solute-binding subunit [uncultured Roseobacter sp.]|uniref:TAXI family TRAP transporter solute-binding subunit n=1 Tax=uncultured Roseobacter sp. TaxID=114847 RepID=UPI002614373F|nr:TAXI family TRAP transporter solute-binding subunit [uncultured Roseobacter sp.]
MSEFRTGFQRSRTIGRVKSAVLSVVCAAAFGTMSVAQSETPTLRITTGGPSGTYYAIARDIQNILPDSIPFEVVQSDGSVHNLRRLLAFEGSEEQEYFQLALVQADVLAQLRDRAEGSDVLQSIVSRIKVVMPLYVEEIHAYTFATTQLLSFEDILSRENLFINAGQEKSGTNLTTRWLIEQVLPDNRDIQLVNVNVGPGLPAMGGSYDVLFDVSGAPNDRGRSIAKERDITLVPIDVPELYELPDSPYVRTKITQDHYSWLTRDIETMGVQALLVTFDYDERNPFCQQIERMTRTILERLPALKDPATDANPAWAEVNPLEGSQRADLYRCSAPVLQGN